MSGIEKKASVWRGTHGFYGVSHKTRTTFEGSVKVGSGYETMAVYNNLRKESPLTAVEFTPVSDGNFAFFYLDSPTKRAAFRQWVTSPEVGQRIMAETSINGRPVLVTHGDKTKEEVMQILEARGDKLELHQHDKPFPFWAVRSTMSVLGQSLQLVSAMSRVKPSETTPGKWVRKEMDVSFVTFATLNMIANIMGFVFGSQKTEDDHHLGHLKEQFNDKLDPHVADGSDLPDAKDKRVKLHLDPQPPKNWGEKTWDFLQRNSVTVGEIGLRFAAAIGLIFPMLKQGKSVGWKEMGKLIAKGEMAEAVKQGVNRNVLPFWAGVGYVTGKTVALFSKVKDPYDPKPHTFLDTIREDYVFKAGSLIEATAGSLIAVNAYKENKIGYGKDPTPMRDWAGTIGGILFAGGYLIRLGAKYGEKQMNMEELHAHISDSLAKVPPEELPQLIADSAATLKEHFKDKPLEFGKIYNQIMTDMYRYHHIALDNLGTSKEERIAKMNQLTNTTPEMLAACKQELEEAKGRGSAPQKSEQEVVGKAGEGRVTETKHAIRHQRKTPSELAAVSPAASHVEKAAQAPADPQLSLGA